MDFYGNIDLLNKGYLQQASLDTEGDFPANPQVGRIAFVNQVVYACVQISNGIPIWVPLTNEVGTYVFNQSTAATTWNITHPLNTTFVLVQTFDGNNKMFIPSNVQINSPTSITISCGQPQAGTATIVAGSLSGNQAPIYSYTYQQTTPQSTWTIVHNLGYIPIVRVFIGTEEVQPASVSFPNNNTVVIAFATAQMGTVKLI